MQLRRRVGLTEKVEVGWAGAGGCQRAVEAARAGRTFSRLSYKPVMNLVRPRRSKTFVTPKQTRGKRRPFLLLSLSQTYDILSAPSSVADLHARSPRA